MPGSKIPFINLARQYEFLREEILDVQDSVYSSGQVLDGEHVERFEELMASRCDRRWAVCVNSGTQALIFALMCSNYLNRNNSGVLLPAVSFMASANAVQMSGQRPLFVDVDYQGLLDFNHVSYDPQRDKIGTLMYVNLYGNIVDQDRVRMYTEFFANNSLCVIEDAAQSFGASWNNRPSGSFGDLSILSFDPMKNLPNYGSGGMVLTNNPEFYRYLLDLRDNGKHDEFISAGTNSKMSESDCAAMNVKLRYFDDWQQRRAEIAEYYDSRLGDYVTLPQTDPKVVHSWHKYVIQTDRRNELKTFLSREGVETRIHYQCPMPMQSSCFDGRTYQNADHLCSRVLSLPIYPELTDEEVEQVAESVIDFWER
jgi:dTDP-4-amino-4,6-dideoxygalactose transaminase